ncbi:MAG: FeoA domain-containing protein, partial [Bacteroidales bacterium]|nr:FeoA domain-containing protein [Bacteroidales bacterium]
MTLRDLKIGQTGRITAVGGEGALRQHLLDMGVIPEAEVTVVKYAPMGDPIEVRIHGYELTLRLADAARIEIDRHLAAPQRGNTEPLNIPHPGLGEEHRTARERAEENPLPKSTVLKFALAGNQNCGKTTLFNQLTGSKQHVGNVPGVTVDRKSGAIKGHPESDVVDLPGIYS